MTDTTLTIEVYESRLFPVIFGSYAREDFDENSDIDIFGRL